MKSIGPDYTGIIFFAFFAIVLTVLFIRAKNKLTRISLVFVAAGLVFTGLGINRTNRLEAARQEAIDQVYENAFNAPGVNVADAEALRMIDTGPDISTIAFYSLAGICFIGSIVFLSRSYRVVPNAGA